MQTILLVIVFKPVQLYCSQIIVQDCVSIYVLVLPTTLATIEFAISPAQNKFLLILLYSQKMLRELV